MAPAPDLAERLEAALLPPPPTAERSTPERLLDAAARRFAEVGVSSTTMSSIAAEAGLSRESLYRHFPNRQAVVVGVVQRELRRFVDGLAQRVAGSDDVVGSLTETFVYCVEFLRDHELVDGLVTVDTAIPAEDLQSRVGAVVAVAVQACAGYLEDLGGFPPAAAVRIAETLTRLVGSTVLAPSAVLDLHDPAVLRDYADHVVRAIVSEPADAARTR